MAVGSGEYYWLICDECRVTSTENAEVSAWDSEDGAVAHAADGGWDLSEGHFCPDCAMNREAER